jgi:dipeptidase D
MVASTLLHPKGKSMTDFTPPEGYDDLTPAAVWKFFAGLAATPRPSKQEAKVCAHMQQLATELGFEWRADAVGNIVIEVPATPGHENAPTVVLQGHVDMVCEKNADVEHDFANDPIRLVLDSDEAGERILRADGTTLGADNGIGVALALAAATDPGIAHGPLEILCTIDEEMGMTGAKALDSDFFRGKVLLNLDSEEDDFLYIGCAGGADVTLSWPLAVEPLPGDVKLYRVGVTGLKGGHSGCDIHMNRGNAIRILARTLLAVDDVRLLELRGGSKRNAIPREASALIALSPAELHALEHEAHRQRELAVHANGETGVKIAIEPAEQADTLAAAVSESRRGLLALSSLPSGVLAVVPEIPDLVQTSNNLSTAVTGLPNGDHITLVAGCLTRSSSMDDIRTTAATLTHLGELSGAKVEVANEYPGWQPDPDSPLLATCRDVYEGLFGETPRVAAIHAGLECGIIGERMGGLDTISFGPRIEGAHSPDERVWIDSVGKIYRYLAAVLEKLAKG